MLSFSTKKIFFFNMFFVNVTFADFNDMREYRYSFDVEESSSLIINDEIEMIIKKNKSNNISKSNDIFNTIFKMLILFLFSILTSMFCVCALQKYHFRYFRETHIITLKKFHKFDYFKTKTYKFIVLLNMFHKIFESIIIKRINLFVEQYFMLFESQIKNWRHKSCKTMLKLFITFSKIKWYTIFVKKKFHNKLSFELQIFSNKKKRFCLSTIKSLICVLWTRTFRKIHSCRSFFIFFITRIFSNI